MPFVLRGQGQWVDNNPYPNVKQADTLIAPALHFWDMHETGSPAALTDVINGATITTSDITTGGVSPYVAVSASTGTGQAIAGAIAIGNRDFLIINSARSVAGVGVGNNGHTGFYWHNHAGNIYKFKNHPYYGMVADDYRSLPYAPNWVRTAGQIYTHAIVRRGTLLEYYCLPKGFVDDFDILKSSQPAAAGYLDPATKTDMGHGGYETPYDDGVGRDIEFNPPWSLAGDVAQDYAGVAVYGFENGAPSMEDVVKGMRWSETEWTTKSTGKRLYPGWR